MARTKCNATASLSDLREGIRSLSDAERSELFESLEYSLARGVSVTIYDGQQRPDAIGHEAPYGSYPDDLKRHRAVVKFGPRGNIHRQEIDILASVRSDAANVGHPAILCAIRFWEGSIICRGRLSGIGGKEGERLAAAGKIAKRHLENLCKSLLKGTREKSWPANYAFDVFRSIVFDSDYYLEHFFDAYCHSGVRKPATLLKMVCDRLREDETSEDGAVRSALPPESLENLKPGFEEVREFLTSSVGKKAFDRRQWSRWKNLFEQWRFSNKWGLRGDLSTHGKYRGSAAAEISKGLTTIGAETFWPERVSATGTIPSHPVVLHPSRNWYMVPATTSALDLRMVLVERR